MAWASSTARLSLGLPVCLVRPVSELPCSPGVFLGSPPLPCLPRADLHLHLKTLHMHSCSSFFPIQAFSPIGFLVFASPWKIQTQKWSEEARGGLEKKDKEGRRKANRACWHGYHPRQWRLDLAQNLLRICVQLTSDVCHQVGKKPAVIILTSFLLLMRATPGALTALQLGLPDVFIASEDGAGSPIPEPKLNG